MYNIIRNMPMVGMDRQTRQVQAFMSGEGAVMGSGKLAPVSGRCRARPRADALASKADALPSKADALSSKADALSHDRCPQAHSVPSLPPLHWASGQGQFGAEGYTMGTMYLVCGLAIAAGTHLLPRVKSGSTRRALGYVLVAAAALSFRAIMGTQIWKNSVRTRWY